MGAVRWVCAWRIAFRFFKGIIMANKVYFSKDAQGNIWAYSFHCPGCNCGHQFIVAQPKNADGSEYLDKKYPIWTFNGNLEKPTFSPSLLYRSKWHPSGQALATEDEHKKVVAGEKLARQPHVCHTFVRDGQIDYLFDCTHEYAGKIIDMEDVD